MPGPALRRPVVAGRFYPAGAEELAREVDEYLCPKPTSEETVSQAIGCVVPHAGYMYSGQLRVLLAAAAYVLLQELRLAAHGTAWARAQVNTLRLELLKIGVLVIASVRRLVLRLPAAFPYRDGWNRIALNSGATSG